MDRTVFRYVCLLNVRVRQGVNQRDRVDTMGYHVLFDFNDFGNFLFHVTHRNFFYRLRFNVTHFMCIVRFGVAINCSDYRFANNGNVYRFRFVCGLLQAFRGEFRMDQVTTFAIRVRYSNNGSCHRRRRGRCA